MLIFVINGAGHREFPKIEIIWEDAIELRTRDALGLDDRALDLADHVCGRDSDCKYALKWVELVVHSLTQERNHLEPWWLAIRTVVSE